LKLDASKACSELGWEPRLNIESALEWTLDWYRAWYGHKNIAEFTAKQIAEYERLCDC
jgi:CDP-glucose 4,6-dehydratase